MVALHTKGKKSFSDMSGTRFLVVEARYYNDIADELLKGALSLIKDIKADYDILSVDGALEIPSMITIALDIAERHSKPYDAVVALGCVIRGETTHYDIVSGESSRALMDLSINRKIPLANGILTVENMDQAWERALTSKMDKGRGAAEAALTVFVLKQKLNKEIA